MIWPTPSSTGSSTMLTDCNSLVTVCASKTGPKPSPLDPMQPVMERSHPTSGRPATPADINRNGRPTSIGTSGRHQSECPADINRNGRPTAIGTSGRHQSECPADIIGMRTEPGHSVCEDLLNAVTLDN